MIRLTKTGINKIPANKIRESQFRGEFKNKVQKINPNKQNLVMSPSKLRIG